MTRLETELKGTAAKADLAELIAELKNGIAELKADMIKSDIIIAGVIIAAVGLIVKL